MFDVAEDLHCLKPRFNATRSAQFNHPQIFHTLVPGANDRPFATEPCTRRSTTSITTLTPYLVSSARSVDARTSPVRVPTLR